MLPATRNVVVLKRHAAGAALALGSIQPHTRLVTVGDSITSQSSTKGVRNWTSWFNFFLNAQFQPAVSGDQGVGGDTMADI
jgi:hypothetical protein